MDLFGFRLWLLSLFHITPLFIVVTFPRTFTIDGTDFHTLFLPTLEGLLS